MVRILRILAVAVLALLSVATLPMSGARAQDGGLIAAKAAGQVGERPDGLIGAVSPNAPADIRALVERINAERMRIYAQAAQRNGTTVDVARRVYGERLTRETPAGQFYMDAAGRWQRR